MASIPAIHVHLFKALVTKAFLGIMHIFVLARSEGVGWESVVRLYWHESAMRLKIIENTIQLSTRVVCLAIHIS